MSYKKTKIIFFIQGEGNGHLTEAIALYEILSKNDYDVCAIVIGEKNTSIELLANFNCDIHKIKSFKKTYNNIYRKVSVLNSLFKNFINLFKYWRSIKFVHKIISQYKPEIIFNFYEPMVGLYGLLYKTKIKSIAIGHQYLYLHPQYDFPKGFKAETQLMKLYTKMTAFNADFIWALSTYKMPNVGLRIQVLPPLLREVVMTTERANENYLLVYLSQGIFLQDIFDWHKSASNEVLHIFMDKSFPLKGANHSNIHIHDFNETLFIKMMGNCKGLICTAGFETICESMYFNKPTLVFPIKRHFGQNCNAVNLKLDNLIYKGNKDLSNFVNNLPVRTCHSQAFFEWVKSRDQFILHQLYKVRSAV